MGKSAVQAKSRPANTETTVGRNDISPELVIEQVPIEKLSELSRNVRKPNKAQIARVVRSIQEFVLVVPVLIGSSFEIIDGSILVEAARQLDLPTVPCIRIDHLSEIAARQLRVTLNKLQETGEWDVESLALEFEDFLEINSDISFTGFEIGEIDNILQIGKALPVDEADSASIPEVDYEVVSRRGDLWILRNHRLLCGDALSRRDHMILRDGEQAQVLYTDPPFNVPINGHVRGPGENQFREFPMASGEMTEAKFTEFLSEALDRAGEGLQPGSVAYVFMDWRHVRELSDALEKAKFRQVNLCVWVKPNGGMGSLYRSRHELVFVSVLGDEKHMNNVQLGKFGRNRTNVWEYAGATGGASLPEDDFTVHPTVKPIQMAADAIMDVTAIGDIVLDMFLGSGSTLLAAERAQRRCFGMELDPAYVDLTIRRWQDMTGESAVHAAGGEAFDDLEGLRREGETSAGTSEPSQEAGCIDEASAGLEDE